MHGKGEIVLKNGDNYVGEMYFGLANGRGRFNCRKGKRNGCIDYDGEWKDDSFHGFGTAKFNNGSTY